MLDSTKRLAMTTCALAAASFARLPKKVKVEVD